MYIFIVGSVLFILVFFIIEVYFYNKFQKAIISINEALNSIDILLQKKFALLEKTIKLIEKSNKKYKEENILANIIKLKNKTVNNFTLNKELEKAFIEYRELLELDAKLSNISSLNNINFELTNVENDLAASKKYYNKHVTIYNKLIKRFPACLVAWLFKYKTRAFYSTEKKETFKILEK